MTDSRPTALADDLAAERSNAIRALLAAPLLDGDADPDAFRLVIRHGDWLTTYFEDACGWTLTVDPAAGFARLAKRAPDVPDPARPLRRTRGEGAPFDRRRYQLLSTVCAELVRRPVTTIGLLASAATGEAGLDTSRHSERGAFVDALRVLVSWGALRVSAGEVDAFVDNDNANAMLSADTARLHRLLVSAAAPSTLPPELDVEAVTRRLLDEPRYGLSPYADDAAERPGPAADDPAAGGLSDEGRNRWARHRLGRRLLDDPALHLDELSAAERNYLASPGGRRWVRDRVAEAGFELEERAEGLLAVDPDAVATDQRFPAPLGNAHQLALLLADRLVTAGADGSRALGRLDPERLRAAVDEVLAKFPRWARAHRDDGGPDRLAREAVDLLVAFGLARRELDGAVAARPALARYAVAAPVVSTAGTLFEEDP